MTPLIPRRSTQGLATSTPAAASRKRSTRPANDPVNKTVYVHAGTYRPAAHGQALIWFNRRHDGITLEAIGEVVLTAANPAIADNKAPSFPAVVTHVVFFGDGISTKTVLRGFRITGAHNYTNGTGQHSPIESDDVPKTAFFYLDGGGIKIYARSYPTVERVDVVDNYTSPCGARRIRGAPRPAARRRGVPRLHFPQQPHADHRCGVRPAARQPRHPR